MPPRVKKESRKKPGQRSRKSYSSLGAELLDKEDGSLRAKGGEIGCSAQAVSLWIRGPQAPTELQRHKIFAAYPRILPTLWESRTGALRAPEPAPRVVAPGPPAAPPQTGPLPALDTREQLVQQAVRLQLLIADPDISVTASLQVERALGQALSSIAKLDGAMITEATVTRHPAFRRLLGVILAALKEHPEAMKAVADAVHAVGDP